MRLQTQVTMTMRELDRLKVIQAVVDRELRATPAAERLQMSVRQIRRLADRYRLEGPMGLVSRHRNRPSNNRLEADRESQVAQILREHYPDFGPTLAMEKLAERHQLVLAKETVRRIQIAAGLWIPRKLRPPKIQQPRTRRACVGVLIQIDGCEHRWFEDRAPLCTALVFMDDATSRLMGVKFTGTESTFAYFEALREYLDRYGKPLALYSDKASIFRVNRPGAVNGPGYTQFSRHSDPRIGASVRHRFHGCLHRERASLCAQPGQDSRLVRGRVESLPVIGGARRDPVARDQTSPR
jgi:transposase